MPTVLVTGGCGFIGSNLVRYLLEAEPDWRILNLDALTYAGNVGNLADVMDHPRHRFVHGDITDRVCVQRVMGQAIDMVVHLAAESHVDRSIQDSGPFVRTNVLGTQILLDAARQFGVKRFLHVSTDEVYGSLGATGYFTEDSPLAANSPYAASKAASDLLVRSYHHTFGLTTIITRCSNNYGPYQFPEKLLPLFITNLLEDKPVPVYGDGLQVRDWIHVRDHCAALHRVLARGTPGAIYNIGGRSERSNLDLTHTLLRLMDKPVSLVRHVADRPGHDRRYAIDCSKIEADLAWQPSISFEVGLRETIQWYKSAGAWLTSVRSGEYRRYCRQQYGDLA